MILEDKKDVSKKIMHAAINEMLSTLKEHLEVLRKLDFSDDERTQFFMDAQINFICSTFYMGAESGKHREAFDQLIARIESWFKNKTQENERG